MESEGPRYSVSKTKFRTHIKKKSNNFVNFNLCF